MVRGKHLYMSRHNVGCWTWKSHLWNIANEIKEIAMVKLVSKGWSVQEVRDVLGRNELLMSCIN